MLMKLRALLWKILEAIKYAASVGECVLSLVDISQGVKPNLTVKLIASDKRPHLCMFAASYLCIFQKELKYPLLTVLKTIMITVSSFVCYDTRKIV